jgi:hypothetical protein
VAGKLAGDSCRFPAIATPAGVNLCRYSSAVRETSQISHPFSAGNFLSAAQGIYPAGAGNSSAGAGNSGFSPTICDVEELDVTAEGV